MNFFISGGKKERKRGHRGLRFLETVVNLIPTIKCVRHNYFTYIISNELHNITQARSFNSSVNGSKAAEWKAHSLALDSGKP